jgi:hypothetical protein
VDEVVTLSQDDEDKFKQIGEVVEVVMRARSSEGDFLAHFMKH